MGRDKSRLPWRGTTLIETVIAAVRQVATPVSVVGGTPVEGCEFVADRWPGFGPVGGIATALLHSRAAYSLVVACDMPVIQPEFLQKLIDGASDHDAAVPQTSDGQIHPLCAVWSSTSLPVFQRAIAANEHTLRRVIEQLNCRFLKADAAFVTNVNTPSEYTEAVAKGE